MTKALGFCCALVATLALGVACTVHQTTEPALAGPSELAQSVAVTISPDTLTLGTSATSAGQTAVVSVRVRDQNGNPVSGKTVRVDISGALSSCGTLGQHNLQTDANGTATTTFTAPGLPMPLPECQGFTNPITIAASVVGSDFQTALPFTAQVRFVPPTVISAPGAIAVSFTISPNPAVVNTQVSFSDAGSTSPGHTIDPSTGFRWDFSDGVTKFGKFVQHDFNNVGTFTATLTVTDDIGQSSFKTVGVIITQ
jgi:hypothetical protein